jgi:hypothetical protein
MKKDHGREGRKERNEEGKKRKSGGALSSFFLMHYFSLQFSLIPKVILAYFCLATLPSDEEGKEFRMDWMLRIMLRDFVRHENGKKNKEKRD